MKRIALAALLALPVLAAGCMSQHSVRVEPIQLQPIQVTMDVNVHVQNEEAETAGDEADDAADTATPVTEDAPRPTE